MAKLLYPSWDTLPALRLLLPFAAGILLASYTQSIWQVLYTDWLFVIAIVLASNFAILLFSILYQPWAKSLRYAWLSGLIAFVLFFGMGYINTIMHTEILYPNHFSHIIADSSFVLMRLDEPPVEREKSYKALVTVLKVASDTGWVACRGKAILYFERDSAVMRLQYGDVVLSNAPLRRVAPPPNPDEFDYAYYLQQQNVWHQAYLGSIFWEKTDISQVSPFQSLVFRMRNYCLKAIQKYIGDDESGGVAAALLIGYTHLLEDDVRKIYSETGVTHVLAVSGMHVGILAALLGFILMPLKKRGGWGIFAHSLLLIIAIWAFTFVTGATPSVIRAAIMFSLLLGGVLYKRKAINFNIIAASAFIILLTNPKTLFHVGFQLSYAAVLSIVLFQRPIEALWQAPNKIMRWIWQITSVTLAAQILTTPLTLYFFHQFPVYFILANVFAVPLSGGILNGGVALLGLSLLANWFSPLQFLAILWGKFLWALIVILNNGLMILGYLPFFTWKGFAPSIAEVVLMYCLILLIVVFLFTARAKFLKYAFVAAITSALLSASKTYYQTQQRGIHVYAIKNGLGMAYIDGKNAVYIGDSIGIQPDIQAYHIQPYNYKHGIKTSEQFPLSLLSNTTYTRQTLHQHLYLSGNFAQFYDKKILICDTIIANLQANSDLYIDYLLLTQNPRIKLQNLSDCVHFKYVIIDASNSRWRIKKWIEECEKIGVPYHNVKDNGAWILDMNGK